MDNNVKKKLSGKKVKKRSSVPLIVGAIFFLIIIVASVIYFTKKPQATITYGICKTYLELNVKYPYTIKMIQVLDYRSKVIMVYRYIDEYGYIKSEELTCYFAINKSNGMLIITNIDRMNIGRNAYEITKKEVATFNLAIPGIMANPPDLTIPYIRPASHSLNDLKD